jgi:hypothetical protein
MGIADNVTLSLRELDQLKLKFGETGALDWIEKLSLWKAASKRAKNVKSDYYTILNWARKDLTIERATPRPAPLIEEAEIQHRALCLFNVNMREGCPRTMEECVAAIRKLDAEKGGL